MGEDGNQRIFTFSGKGIIYFCNIQDNTSICFSSDPKYPIQTDDFVCVEAWLYFIFGKCLQETQVFDMHTKAKAIVVKLFIDDNSVRDDVWCSLTNYFKTLDFFDCHQYSFYCENSIFYCVEIIALVN